MLEETKKEVREIKAIESQMKWNMQREEKREKTVEAKETEEEIRDWRWRQSDEMKAYVEENKHEVHVTEIKENKEFQEFKREVKAVVKEEDKRYYHEEYLKDTDNAAWRAELAKVIQDNDKVLTLERVEDVKEIREIKTVEKVQAKIEDDANREHEQALEMANQAKALQKEREQLLQSLEYARSCSQRIMPLAGAARSSGLRSSPQIRR